ncbi:MAG: shikimate dehydrogenase [Zetaproteobacteria bacterium CG_4_9_14_3_um_filter_49_83]|nr:MAG: hypothetical protein AUJ56_02445 [Zetaproteobacteria bacterium CG1_02_49_23]PIQ30059.1 MAG: shikimate dehydrogenase [Zetaproteobacteria bacterium CG17_big_fil_post_rev_8_21_14_2_50_50_13]PIV29199.1 MAG: shikimate dehydrogenase [Zetaproteobacteria bacterium CG02_land_8_20_14_3_00_50_9]PIY55993.1 MAG: shikimate dehydrogenase [Zetaproteobacteria bacterium CG_4_10_14_0_8_um_filter_49_80]PJA36331.1 MAG: shikimate dehydrogenase [Zetaproteobacteria bacterium CG_4_9_14_3_um_filter_49_83]
MNINGETNVYGIIGNPVSHSLSPLFQNYFLELGQLNGVYVPFHVERDSLTDALSGLIALGVRGVNVTIPYKEDALRHIITDAESAMVGAINTIKFEDGQTTAKNTDWIGVKDALIGIGAGTGLEDSDVLMIGAGGTARAVIHALENMNAVKISICNRNTERLNQLLAHARLNYPRVKFTSIPWEHTEVEQASNSASLVINCTSVGLHGEPFPFAIKGKGFAFDIVYEKKGFTSFCQQAHKCGRVYADGLPMLIAQGAASFVWWHGGQTPDKLATMRWIEQKLGRSQMLLPGWEAAG